MKKWLITLVALIFLATGTQASVLIQDGFDDGDRSNGADALDVDWWKVLASTLSIDTTGGMGSGNALSVVGTGTSNIIANFPTQVLDSEGARMIFSFDIQITELANDNIRFGLLDSGGTLVEEDVTVDDLADNDGGYFFRLGTGTSTNTKFYEDGGTSGLLGGGDLATRTSGVFGIGDTDLHSIKMIYTYTGGNIQVDFILDEGQAGEQSLSWTDTSNLKQNYNEAAIAIRSGMDALIDNIVVEYTEVSNFEPDVDAGADAVLFLGESLELHSTSEDPEGMPLTYEWSATGPGTATFIPDETTENPAVSFDAVGTYTLELAASDGAKTGTDTLTVIVRDPSEKALLALWDFETIAPSDPNVYDTAGTNEGAWNTSDPNYVDGWISGASPDLAAKFFGDEYITIQPDPNMNPNLNDGLQYGLSVACWIRVDDAEGFEATDRIIEKDAWSLLAAPSGSGSVKFGLSGQPGSGINGIISVTDGYWHHVAGVYDGQSMSIYIDGIQEATRTTNGFLTANTSPVTIGAANDGDQVLSGTAVDDIRVYNYGLDADEVAALAAMGDNLVPRIEAVTASEQAIQLPVDTISLSSTSFDPDLNSLTYKWSKADGPAEVSFTTGSQPDTDAVFTKEGRYTLRISVDDGMAEVSAEISVLVYPDGWNGELAYMPYDIDPDDATFWGYTATVYGTPSYTAGKIGSGAIEFNGTTDYLEYDPELGSDVTDLTFAAWVRPNEAADMEVAGNYPNYDGEEQGWRLWFDDAGYFKLWMGEKHNINQTWNMTEATYTAGQWVHVAMTFKYYEEDRNEVKFYVNGQNKLDVTTNYRVFPNPTIPFTVGRRPVSNSSYLNGAIDDMWLFGRVLAQDEIAELAGLNIPPIVDAGESKKIILPTDSVLLDGSAVDEDPITVSWSVAEGQASNVSFDPVDDPDTTVTFTQAGDYLLRLTATDSFNKTATDDVLVKVRPVGFDGLEAYITFENADPNLALDSAVGIGYQGIAYGDPNAGFDATEKWFGDGALELFGQDEYVEYSKFLGSDPAMSVSVWFNCKDLSTGGRIVDKWAKDPSGIGWFIRVRNGDGNLAAMIGSDFGSGVFLQAPTGTFAEGDWVHAVLTFEDGVMRLYQNGALVRQAVNVTFSPADFVTPLNVGRRQNPVNEHFTGIIDEIRIYDYALSVEEVKAMYTGDGGLPWNTCPNPSLAGDLNKDCRIDVLDVADMSAGWQSTYNIMTLQSMAQDWLDCDSLDLSDCF